MFSSCRFPPPCSPRWHAPAGVRPGSHPAKSSAFAPPHPCAASTRRSVFVRRQPSGRASPPSSPSSPPMRCPGSGLQRSRRLLASKPLRPPRRSRGATASPASGRRWQTSLRRHGNLLASQVPRRGRLYPYKGTRGARIVSARRGELMRSFRGAQVRGPVRLWVRRSGSALADRFTLFHLIANSSTRCLTPPPVGLGRGNGTVFRTPLRRSSDNSLRRDVGAAGDLRSHRRHGRS